MIELAPDQVVSAFRTLFPVEGHTYRRCFAVLEGISGGRILTDDPTSPSWGAVHELSSDGSLFLGGALTRDLVASVIEELRRERMVTIGLTQNDPLGDLLPNNATEEGGALDFEDRDTAVDLEAFVNPPAELRLARIDQELEPRTLWTPWMSVDGASALEHGLGYCLLDGDVIVSEAFAGPAVDGMLEIAVITRGGYRQRGLARIVAARAVLECERLGYRTWWNTSLENVASASLARSLGYQTERRYRTLVWNKDGE
jgi:hypothetical protein